MGTRTKTASHSVAPKEKPGGNLARVDFALSYYRHLKKLRIYVDQHWDKPIRLADAAPAIGVSPSTLSRLFHQKTGMHFGDWIRLERIRRAQDLLGTSDMSISDVAYAVGFRGTRSFERSFKKVAGVSASEYRKKTVKQTLSHI